MLGGSFCSFCSETEKEFLTVDHKNDDGYLDRSSNSSFSAKHIYSRIKSGLDTPNRFQVLCWNCNRSKPPLKKSVARAVGIKKTCLGCGNSKDESEFHLDGIKRRSRCSTCISTRRLLKKHSAYQQLGGCCSCCGESRYDRLALDHIKNDGADRRRFGEISIVLYGQVLSGRLRTNIQLLCHNCNASKYYGRSCIHMRAAVAK